LIFAVFAGAGGRVLTFKACPVRQKDLLYFLLIIVPLYNL
jgi:hypothetical protein